MHRSVPVLPFVLALLLTSTADGSADPVPRSSPVPQGASPSSEASADSSPGATAADEGERGGKEGDEEGETALGAADRRYHEAAGSRDREVFLELLAGDAVFLGGELHRGRSSFVEGWGPLWTGKYEFSYRGLTLESVAARSGELGFTVAEATTRFRRPHLEPESIEGHSVTVWAREAGGPWRVKASASLVVHPSLGAARDPRSGLMTAWPELADRIGDELEIRWTPEATVRADSGELAYSLGTYRASFGRGEEATAGEGHYLAVWRKDEKDRWQLAAEGFTPPGIHTE